MIGISDKQGEMLAFIESFVAKHGYPPTREEIRTGLKISTKSLVNYHLEALENAALLKRIPNTPRGLQLTGENGFKKSIPSQLVDLPTPEIPVLEQDDVIELTYGAVTNNSNLYALKIEKNSVTDEQVSEGDIVILQRQSRVQNGEMVVLRLLKSGKTALKKYYRENGHVRLEAASPKAKPLIVAPNAVEIHGKVVAIIRQVD